jgi:hypothetical protein
MLLFRVTRLCEFSPIGRLFTLSSFLIIKEAKNCEQRISPVKVIYEFWENIGSATLGRFFTNSSGRPASLPL